MVEYLLTRALSQTGACGKHKGALKTLESRFPAAGGKTGLSRELRDKEAICLNSLQGALDRSDAIGSN